MPDPTGHKGRADIGLYLWIAGPVATEKIEVHTLGESLRFVEGQISVLMALIILFKIVLMLYMPKSDGAWVSCAAYVAVVKDELERR